MASKVAKHPVETIVETGALDANSIHTPGIFIKRMVVGAPDQRIEQRTVRKFEGAA